MSAGLIITKHCREIDQGRMLQGHFKIGSLSEYRAYESTIGTLSDREEGIAFSHLSHDLANFSSSVGGLTLSNVNASSGSIAFSSENEAAIFCASLGAYSEARHRRLVLGDEGYPGNPELTHYVEISGDKFAAAMFKLVEPLGFEGVRDAEVSYEGRDDRFVFPAQRHENPELMWERLFLTALFKKPASFVVEEEYRFALTNADYFTPVDLIFTENLGAEISAMFANTIMGAGSLTLDG